MENATKALLIAAAILVAIVIISIGMVVLKQGSSTSDQAGEAMSDAEVTSFNAKFNSYIGNSVNGAQLTELLKKVSTNNQDEGDTGDNRFVTVIIDGTSYGGNASAITPPSLSRSDVYRVKISKESNNDTIQEITATKK